MNRQDIALKGKRPIKIKASKMELRAYEHLLQEFYISSEGRSTLNELEIMQSQGHDGSARANNY